MCFLDRVYRAMKLPNAEGSGVFEVFGEHGNLAWLWARSAQAFRLSCTGRMACCMAAGSNFGADSDRVFAIASNGVFLNMADPLYKCCGAAIINQKTDLCIFFSYRDATPSWRM